MGVSVEARIILTGVPIETWANNSSMSLLCIRMQPKEAAVPMLRGLLVPWIPYQDRERPSQREPKTLRGSNIFLLMTFHSPKGVGV